MEQLDPEWLQVVIAFLALLAAVVAGIVSWNAYKTSYRPIVRVVPLSTCGDSDPRSVLLDRLVLKNIGRGPAISIVIAQRRGSSPSDLIGEVDALEPLGETYGPNFKESARVGRAEVHLNEQLVGGKQYRVLYADIAGGWHETEFTVVDDTFEIRLALPRLPEEIPNWVRERSQIVTGA